MLIHLSMLPMSANVLICFNDDLRKIPNKAIQHFTTFQSLACTDTDTYIDSRIKRIITECCKMNHYDIYT